MGSRLLFPAMAFIFTVSVSLQAAAGGESEMNMVFYMHNNLMGRNVTAIPVAGLNGPSSSSSKFGTLVVISDVITNRPYVNPNPDCDSDSDNIVGQAQGTYVNTNPVSGLDYFTVFTLIFHNVKYSGSTLEIQGTDRFDQPKREYAVVGGTGKFKFALGYVIVSTESTSGMNAVLKLNTTLLISQ